MSLFAIKYRDKVKYYFGVINTKKRLSILTLFFTLFIYNLSPAPFVPAGDAYPNLFLPVSLLKDGGFSFQPETFPWMFGWNMDLIAPNQHLEIRKWGNELIQGKTLLQWKKEGKIRVGPDVPYFLTKSYRVDEELVSTFGPVSGLIFTPFVLFVKFFKKDLLEDFKAIHFTGKAFASFLTALSCMLIFLIASSYCSTGFAFLICLSFGFGTCVWPWTSQTLFQQTVNIFFLLCGFYFLIMYKEQKYIKKFDNFFLALASSFFAAAAATRSTSAIFWITALLYLLIFYRKDSLTFLICALPIFGLVGLYNFYYFGNPFTVAQSAGNYTTALQKNNYADLWPTPLWLGAAGLLFSPSRGLFVFSPFLIFSFWGLTKIFREKKIYFNFFHDYSCDLNIISAV